MCLGKAWDASVGEGGRLSNYVDVFEVRGRFEWGSRQIEPIAFSEREAMGDEWSQDSWPRGKSNHIKQR